MPLYKAILPDGRVFWRTDPRRFTHVVVGRLSYGDAIRRIAGMPFEDVMDFYDQCDGDASGLGYWIDDLREARRMALDPARYDKFYILSWTGMPATQVSNWRKRASDIEVIALEIHDDPSEDI